MRKCRLTQDPSSHLLDVDGQEEGLRVLHLPHLVQHLLEDGGQRDHGVDATTVHSAVLAEGNGDEEPLITQRNLKRQKLIS